MEELKVRQIECCRFVAFYVTVTGKIYSTGKNICGLLGRDDYFSDTFVPLQVPGLADKRVQQVSSGLHHALALTDNHEVYAWGSSDSGQLSLPRTQKWKSEYDYRRGESFFYLEEPSPIPFFSQNKALLQIKQVACGRAFSMALSVSGMLYSWGDNRHGQLGRGRDRYGLNLREDES